MVKRQLKLREHGMRKFTVCERCNLQFESKRLNPYKAEKAEKEILEKLDGYSLANARSQPNQPRSEMTPLSEISYNLAVAFSSKP